MVFANRNFRLFAALLIGLVSVVAVPGISDAAPTRTLGQMTNNLYDSLISLQFFLSLLSYIIGIFFSITGFKMLREHVDDPNRNPAKGPLLRLAGAAFFIFAPFFANALIESIRGDGGNAFLLGIESSDFAYKNSNAATLENALGRFASDFGGPLLDNLLPFFAFISGLILMMIGLKRLALANGDGPQAPNGVGTLGTFFVAAALMSFGYIMYAFQASLFGQTELFANQVLTDSTTKLSQNANRALWGVFIFLRIVGYISVLRGLFMLRAVAEGGNVSMMAVGTHMIAGSLLANGGYLVTVLQYTFIGNDTSKFIFNPV